MASRPAPHSAPISAVVLAYNEAANISRAVLSVAWCAEVVVVDSGSTDGTQKLAEDAGATVLEEPWRGFAGQREWVLRHAGLRHDWVYFIDADEWVSDSLAAEVAGRLGRDGARAYRQRRKLIFLGRWIAHCGWYENSWQTRLFDRRFATFAAAADYGERVAIDGEVATLAEDLVDEDDKGLANWLHKHVDYAALEVGRRAASRGPARTVVSLLRSRAQRRRRPLARTLAKDVVLPAVPAKPLALFVYMYLIRAGWRDGRAGFVFCCYHAWFELTVGVLRWRETALGRAGDARRAPTDRAPYTPADTVARDGRRQA